MNDKTKNQNIRKELGMTNIKDKMNGNHLCYKEKWMMDGKNEGYIGIWSVSAYRNIFDWIYEENISK